ncbi:hypothetical protein WME89_24850 [Sorangium sp. So ce321]|uniref:hypothetical protein n=1 Tax=Sorangium sp. So ce321 TaxID=3133300 RepID=UPI003F5DAA9F
MRHLVFDYPNDEKVFNIKDQFLFGPAFLINPVTTAGRYQPLRLSPRGDLVRFWTAPSLFTRTRATAMTTRTASTRSSRSRGTSPSGS